MTSKAERLQQTLERARKIRDEQLAPLEDHVRNARNAVSGLVFDVQDGAYPCLSFGVAEAPGYVDVTTQGYGFTVPIPRMLEAARWLIATFGEEEGR